MGERGVEVEGEDLGVAVEGLRQGVAGTVLVECFPDAGEIHAETPAMLRSAQYRTPHPAAENRITAWGAIAFRDRGAAADVAQRRAAFYSCAP